VDTWIDMPFFHLDTWELKDAFAGVFTASRMTQAAFRSAGIPVHILWAANLTLALTVPSHSLAHA
jgi:hypothetical protein